MPLRDPLPLFVYGTLRRGCPTPMAEWLGSTASWIGMAQIRGRLYRLDGYPGLVPDENGGLVQGDLFRLPDGAAGDALLARLDAYEECAPDCPAPHEYARVVLPVLFQGTLIEAWTYIYRRPTDALDMIESGDFLRDAVPPSR